MFKLAKIPSLILANAPPLALSRSARAMSTKVDLSHPIQNAEIFEAELLNGTSPEILKRKVRIYKPVESTMQSGQSGHSWVIDWDITDRWSNPVMGWASSADPMQALMVKFETKEQAILFCARQGYEWTVQEPKPERWTKKTYADNYTFVPGHLRLHKTK